MDSKERDISGKIVGIRCCANFSSSCKCPRCGAALYKNVREHSLTILVCSEYCGWDYQCSSGGHAPIGPKPEF